ncbi:MAG: lamin tail domain-containing protein, partial [Candidatus Limnocylindrales bacterium]
MSSRPRAAAPSLAAITLTLVVATGLVRAAPPELPTAAAAATWPVATGPLVSEVMTGGVSASDEFVELYDAGPTPVDLAGDEVVYVSATGGTLTRKASWPTTQLLAPGQHLLLADGSGTYAAHADLTSSGGLAAAGGSIVLRTADGTVIDAIGWGSATNAFVEGTAAGAPPPPSSRAPQARRPARPANNHHKHHPPTGVQPTPRAPARARP